MSAVAIDASALRRSFAAFPSGVAAICGIDARRVPIGMAVSTFTPVSLSPPLASVCIQLSSTTWPRLVQSPMLGVSILGADQEEACRALAHAPAEERLDSIAWTPVEDGAVLIDGASAHFVCSLSSTIEAGDHIIAVLRLHAADHAPKRSPLVYCRRRYRALH